MLIKNCRGIFCRIILLFITLLLAGCQSGINYEKIRSEILEKHNELINAHHKKDIDFFVKDLADNFISVSGGEINYQTKEEVRSNFSAYLNSTEFYEYKNLCDPIIGYSNDGSIAWSVVQVKISGERSFDDGTKRELDFICAWMTMWKKEESRWVKTMEVSNFK